MRKIAGWVARIICPAVILLLLWYGLECYRSAGILEQNITIWKSDGYFTIPEMQRIKDQQQQEIKQIQDFTAWSEEKGAWLSARDTGRLVSANAVTIYGSSELLLPYGRILNQEDVKGCLIGTKTAEKLFGNRNAGGLSLYYHNVEFIVRGVIDTPEELLIVQAAALPDVQFDRITVRREKGMQIKQFGEAFMSGYGLDGKLLRWDYCHGLSWLEELIPGKWSDFDGWSEKIASKKQDFSILSAVEKSSIELTYLEIQKRGQWCLGGGGLLGILAACFTIRFFRRKCLT